MDINTFDGSKFVSVVALSTNNDATAGGTGDATEVTCAEIDLDGYTGGFLAIQYVTSLTADKTLAFETQYAGADTTGGSLTTDAVVESSTVVKTGAATAAQGVKIVDLGDIRQYKRFSKFKVTPELSHSGTDTATWSVAFVGFKRNS